MRAFGSNNLPDFSNMCHESSGVAPTDTIGIGKGSAVAAASLKPRGPAEVRVRRALAVLAAVLLTAVVLTGIPMETSDSFGGYRIFGLVAYAAAGLSWACLGLVLGDAEAHPRAPRQLAT